MKIYQIGFLEICDTPDAETIAAAREVGYQLYAIRSAKKVIQPSSPDEISQP